MNNENEARIIPLHKRPFDRDKFEQRETARIIDLRQLHCDHLIQVDEDDETGHICEHCGKVFNSNEALMYLLRKTANRDTIYSYNLRNEINFLTEKRDNIKCEIRHLQQKKASIE